MLKNNPLVSVIINCYNGERYLQEAIDSVINQTYDNWEIIFWDNQSTDLTAEIVKGYDDSRIHYFYAANHTTLGEARNLAVEKANGEYINFLDADDIWAINKLERQVELIIPGISEVVYSNFEVISGDEESTNTTMLNYYEEIRKYHPNKKKSVYHNLLYRNWIIFSSVLFNKQLFIKVGGVNPSFKQNEDYELLLKCSLETKLILCTDTLVYYRIHQSNNSILNNNLYLIENRQIFNNLPASPELEEAKKMNEVRYSIYLWKNRKKQKAIKHLLYYGSVKALIKLCLNRL